MENISLETHRFFFNMLFPTCQKGSKKRAIGKKKFENRNFTLNLSKKKNKLFNLQHQYLIDLKIN